jgi:transcriptional regulator with XRE-family HTH domain
MVRLYLSRGDIMKFKINDYSRGEIIKIIREWTELTQTEFGKRIGKSKPSVQDYELEKTNYGIDVLMKIADEFGLIITVEKKK